MNTALHNMLCGTTGSMRYRAKTHQDFRMSLTQQYSVNLDELDAVISDVEANLASTKPKSQSQFNKKQSVAGQTTKKNKENS